MAKHNYKKHHDEENLPEELMDLEDIENKHDTSNDEIIMEKHDKMHKKSDKKLSALKEEKEALNDKYLRLYSEFENYRKRTSKERLELDQKVKGSLIKELLPVLDDFDRALENIPADDERTQELRNGVELIYNKMKRILELKGLKEIELSAGSDFDTDYQEAITTIPAPSEALKDKVVDVIEKGYMLNDIVIRFAKVVVGI
ncbi:MAG: nucleotide exchange factor GrpE [Bacteroidales bacterium]|jgi:molecular chaperone GrpE|nr:nucleotide exchange factor GrpE [Bacteroidales bacterium]